MSQKGIILKITPKGLENSLREKKDGNVYFGCKRRDKKISEGIKVCISHQGEIINDFVIPAKDKDIEEKHR